MNRWLSRQLIKRKLASLSSHFRCTSNSSEKSMGLPVYKVDVFTKDPFRGNPAAVCIIVGDFPKVLDDTTMLNIAHEVNISDTAFLHELETGDLSKGKRFNLRWFTPTTESVLCGHATLATAVVLFNKYNNSNNVLEFDTLSGVLKAERKSTGAVLDLPIPELTDQIPSDSYAVIQAISEELYRRRDELVILYHVLTKRLLVQLPASWGRRDLDAVKLPTTDAMLSAHGGEDIRGVMLTCSQPLTPDQPYDFFSRYFGHWNGIPEDPATGSAHAALGKFWSERLNKTQLFAHQCSERGGDITITVNDTDRIFVGGDACIVMSGQLHI